MLPPEAAEVSEPEEAVVDVAVVTAAAAEADPVVRVAVSVARRNGLPLPSLAVL